MTGRQNKLSLLIFSIILTLISCATQSTNTQVNFSTQGASSENTPGMAETCKQFQLSKADVIKFYHYSRQYSAREIHDEFDVLPCYSTGQITTNNETWDWLIRAGGTGSFNNNKQQLLRACDVQCCNILKNIC